MLRKFLMSFTALALVGCMVFSVLQLAPILSSIEIGDVGDRFTKAEKRYTVTATASEGGRVEGIADDYAKGESATLLAVADDGYLFGGWYSNSGACKATSPSYTFNVEKSTSVVAKFVPAPDKMDGDTEYSTEYTDCTEDFAFSVFCDEENAAEIIAAAIKIVDADLLDTEYEALGTVTPVIIALGGGEYSVSPSGKYRKGTTYVAKISDPSVTLPVGTSITFTVIGDKNSNVSYNEGIVYLDRATVTVEDDYIITSHPLAKNDIVCIYTEVDTDNDPVLSSSEFVKITSVDGERAYYTKPDIDDVYETIDLYYKEDLEPEAYGLASPSELEAQIYAALMSDEGFAGTVA